MIQLFNFIYFMLMVASIMYLFSSGKEYMLYANETAGRTHTEDKVAMSVMAGFSFYGAFHQELCSWYTYFIVFPLLVHLMRIAYLSYKFKNRKINGK